MKGEELNTTYNFRVEDTQEVAENVQSEEQSIIEATLEEKAWKYAAHFAHSRRANQAYYNLPDLTVRQLIKKIN